MYRIFAQVTFPLNALRIPKISNLTHVQSFWRNNWLLYPSIAKIAVKQIIYLSYITIYLYFDKMSAQKPTQGEAKQSLILSCIANKVLGTTFLQKAQNQLQKIYVIVSVTDFVQYLNKPNMLRKFISSFLYFM